jgi:hypothetical protein
VAERIAPRTGIDDASIPAEGLRDLGARLVGVGALGPDHDRGGRSLGAGLAGEEVQGDRDGASDRDESCTFSVHARASSGRPTAQIKI